MRVSVLVSQSRSVDIIFSTYNMDKRSRKSSKRASCPRLDKQLAPQYGKKARTHALTLTFKHMITLKRAKYILLEMMYTHTKLHMVWYPEYTMTGRVHWHGTVTETNKQRYNSFLSHWKIFGFHKESKLTNRIAWHIYCIKDQHLFKRQPTRLTTPYVNRRFRVQQDTIEEIFAKIESVRTQHKKCRDFPTLPFREVENTGAPPVKHLKT